MGYLLLIVLVLLTIIIRLPSVKGAIGEGWVRYYLNKLDSDKYIVIHDILLPTDNGKTSQIDHLIISPFGLFVVETKNYKGWIFGDEKNKYWTQVIYNRKEKFHNPIFQNYGHVKAIESLLGEKISPYIISVICFNAKAKLKKIDVKSDYVRVVYDKKIVKEIQQFNRVVLTYQEQLNIEQTIISHMITGKDARKLHVKNIRETQNQIKTKVKSNICPKCNGALVKRKGSKGLFTGCSNYPNCKFVQSGS